MSKIIVTGGAGFIGSHLVDALIEKGEEVFIIDNLETGYKKNLNSKAKFFNKDIKDFDSIAPIFNDTDYVFHLAALPRVEPSILDPRTSNDTNTTGTLNVLVASRDAKVKRIIYSASSAAYGNKDVMPLNEDLPAEPLSPYALQKYIGELYCSLFSKIYNLETVSLRYFNVYGPRSPIEGAYALVIGKMINARLAGKKLPIVPDGNQTRDFTHVRDVVNANILAMESNKVGRGEVINIGAGDNHSVNEIASLIGGPTEFIEARIEPKNTLADNSRAREFLGWTPKVNFANGILELKQLYNI